MARPVFRLSSTLLRARDGADLRHDVDTPTMLLTFSVVVVAPVRFQSPFIAMRTCNGERAGVGRGMHTCRYRGGQPLMRLHTLAEAVKLAPQEVRANVVHCMHARVAVC